MLQLSEHETREDGLTRQWYRDDYFDLYVWSDAAEEIAAFQLCYDKLGEEGALTWSRDRETTHRAVDAGESNPTKSASPVLTASMAFPGKAVRRRFVRSGAELPEPLQKLVLEQIDLNTPATRIRRGK